MTDEFAKRALLNQIEIMSSLDWLLRHASPDLVGRAGALDRQLADLFACHKATERTLAASGKERTNG